MLGILLATLSAAALHLAPGPHHHFWPGPFGGYGYPGYGYGAGVSVLPSTGLTYINGVPYEVIGGQLVAVSVGGVGIL